MEREKPAERTITKEKCKHCCISHSECANLPFNALTNYPRTVAQQWQPVEKWQLGGNLLASIIDGRMILSGKYTIVFANNCRMANMSFSFIPHFPLKSFLGIDGRNFRNEQSFLGLIYSADSHSRLLSQCN